MESQFKILLTNDDGIDALGLRALLQTLRGMGEIVVVAPKTNQSGCSMLRTFSKDISIEEKSIPETIRSIAVDSTTADCVGIALQILDTWKPDIVVSGINLGENTGYDVLYSGTLAGALEAAMHGLPSLAVSLAFAETKQIVDYQNAANIARNVVEETLRHKIPPYTLLNLNIPSGEICNIKVTTQGQTKYNDSVILSSNAIKVNTNGKHSLIDDEETDTFALRSGFATLTPLQLDMTAHHLISKVKSWEIKNLQ